MSSSLIQTDCGKLEWAKEMGNARISGVLTLKGAYFKNNNNNNKKNNLSYEIKFLSRLISNAPINKTIKKIHLSLIIS